MAPILREAIKEKVLDNRDGNVPMTQAAFIVSNANGVATGTPYDIAIPGKNNNLFLGACYDFVNYQINDAHTCNGNYNLFLREGFQIGSPWHGDIVQAPVMFLSVNPAITQYCVFPRFHPNFDGGTDDFTLAGEDGAGNKDYNIAYNGTVANNILNAPENIYNFIRDRLRTTKNYVNPAGIKTVSPAFWTVNPPSKTTATNQDQSYWKQALINVMDAFHGNTDGLTQEEHNQNLMNATLSTEIIFWGSANAAGAMNPATPSGHATLQYFWNNFTAPMIENSGAELIFIVGANARNTFNAVYGGAPLNSGDIRSFTSPSGRIYQLAAIGSPGGGLRLNDINDVINRLTGAIPDANRNPAIMDNVIAKINALY